MTTVYYRTDRNRQLEWLAGVIGADVANAGYPTFDVDRAQEKFDMVEGATDIGCYQPDRAHIGGRRFEFGFSIHVAGILAADGGPVISPLLRACGMKETVTGTTPNKAPWYQWGNPHLLTDTLAAGDCDPVDIIINQDMLKRTAGDCVGNAVLRWEARKRPFVKFAMNGTCGAARYASSGTQTGLSSLTPGPVSVGVGAASTSITFLAESAITSCIVPFIEVDLKNTTDVRDDIGGTHGYSAPRLTGGFPTLKMQVEMQDLTIADWELRRMAGDYVTIKWAHNPTGGTGVAMTHGFRGYITGLDEVEHNGKLCYDVTLEQILTSGAGFWMAWASVAAMTPPF